MSAHNLQPSTPQLGSVLRNAARYWEPLRVLYNVVLAIVAGLWLTISWPHFRPAMQWQSLFLLLILGALANVCYSAAYLADLPMQYSFSPKIWNRCRWTLWVAGMAFATLLANYWIADEIYPYVR